jgi:PIN domain nuclease of toxin-antitoxin system
VDPKTPPLAVTDTHALIWAIDGNRKRLGKRARKLFDSADEAKCAIYIPAFVLAELGEACHEDRVTLALPFEQWARAAFASGKYHTELSS